MPRFAILANNGFNYELVLEISAPSVQAARKWFKRVYAGDYRIEDFRVSRRMNSEEA